MKKTILALAAGVALTFGAGAAQACNRGVDVCSFKLFNNTSVELESFWASPPSVNDWENDILGDRTLDGGMTININMSDGRPDCIYDFKFKFSDGDIVEKRRINVCRLGQYTLNE
jgi:hypothetical protein